MLLQLNIDLDNDAFTADPAAEVERILIASCAAFSPLCYRPEGCGWLVSEAHSIKLFDTNGNPVGELRTINA